MTRPTLDEILSDDSDLLDVKAAASTASTEHQRVIDSLAEINRFIDRFKRRPGETDKPSVSERGSAHQAQQPPERCFAATRAPAA